MPSPKVSVLMPIRNTPEVWLRTAVRTMANQSHPNLDLILIDNGSTRATTVDIIKEAKDRWPDRIILASEPDKQGTAYALDAGMKASDPETVYYSKADGDDIFHKDREANRVKLFETLPPQVAILYENFFQLNYNIVGKDKDGNDIIRPQIQPIILRPYDYRACLEESLIPGNSMWRSSVYDKIPRSFVYDGYEGKAQRHAEDYALWLSITDHYDAYWYDCDPAMSWTYRMYAGSKYNRDRKGSDYAKMMLQQRAKERRGLGDT